VCERTARMIVHWMRVGFVHGVMNTDNMSVLGLTIDYGPYGWLDDFDPNWTPNTTDADGRRYRYGWQPRIAQWNLVRLAEAVLPLFDSEQPVRDALDRYGAVFAPEYERMLLAKAGLRGADGDAELAGEVLQILYSGEMDYTLFFRALGEIRSVPEGDDAAAVALLGDVFYDEGKRIAQTPALARWLRRWHAAASRDGEPFERRRERMHRVNPRYVLRNYLAQEAIDAAEAGDASLVHTLLDVMRRPYDDQPVHARHAARRPEWARSRAGCSMLSCSS
jgi:serine/tyrosine/threonine adenylyltransferase